MTSKDREEVIELETILIAVNDKLHRIQEDFLKIKTILNNTQKRIDVLKGKIVI